MDKPDVSSLLGDLAPTTEYAQFLELWPDVKKSIDRKIRLNVIHKTLTDANVLSVSYVTFTRFVKKASEEKQETVSRPAAKKKTENHATEAGSVETGQQENPPANNESGPEKSERVATASTDALKEAQQTSSKNYAATLKKRH